MILLKPGVSYYCVDKHESYDKLNASGNSSTSNSPVKLYCKVVAERCMNGSSPYVDPHGKLSFSLPVQKALVGIVKTET
jgi:hypothetical protein